MHNAWNALWDVIPAKIVILVKHATRNSILKIINVNVKQGLTWMGKHVPSAFEAALTA